MSLRLDVNQKPKNVGQWLGLSLQHVFAMFGATVLVPLLTGLDVSVALFASGLGTLIYILCTKAKVPVYLGSSFAYIGAIIYATNNAGIESAFVGLMVVGLVYMLVSLIVTFAGTKWLDFILPAIVVGPMIAVIGLSLAPVAINMAGLNPGELANNGINYEAWKAITIALVTFLTTILIAIKGKGFLQIIPFLVGIVAGYLTAVALGVVDFSALESAKFFQLPSFNVVGTYDLNFSAIITFLPLAFVTIAEHIGDHKVLGEICDRDFLGGEPGLNRTILGDGVATFVSAALGGPANTTYGENTGVVAMTKVASVYITGTAACFAIIMSFFGHIQALIGTIPTPVMGGVSMVLFGLIASNGLKVLSKAGIDFNETKNIIIIAAMLVIGLGGAKIVINDASALTGMSLAVIAGVTLNLIFIGLDKLFPEKN